MSEFEKFSAKDSYFTLQLIFKKLWLVECCSSIKKENHNSLKKLLFFPLSTIYLEWDLMYFNQTM